MYDAAVILFYFMLPKFRKIVWYFGFPVILLLTYAINDKQLNVVENNLRYYFHN